MEYIIYFVIGVMVVLWLISFYFVKTKRMTGQDWYVQSLGLPQGSVRALIALILLLWLVFSAVTKQPIPDLPDWMVGILGTVIGFYFGSAMVPKTPKPTPTPTPTPTPENPTPPQS